MSYEYSFIQDYKWGCWVYKLKVVLPVLIYKYEFYIFII